MSDETIDISEWTPLGHGDVVTKEQLDALLAAQKAGHMPTTELRWRTLRRPDLMGAPLAGLAAVGLAPVAIGKPRVFHVWKDGRERELKEMGSDVTT